MEPLLETTRLMAVIFTVRKGSLTMASKQSSKAASDKQAKQDQSIEHQESESTKAIASDAQTEPDQAADFDELVEALSGDLSEIEPEAGMELISEWQAFLSDSKEAGVKELASGLKELQKLLKSGKATGHDISEVLIHLGEQTAEFASEAEKGSKQTVQRLAKQLRTAGTSIAKAEDKEYLEQIDSLVEQAESDELTTLESDAAISTIDTWYNLLHKSEDAKLQSVANSLKELKQALKRSNAKPDTIAHVLTQLGEQTVEAASEAPRGFKGAIQKLGKQLSRAGASLSEAE
jgi:hypothetical protein